jgi:hypothetical protein
LEVLLLRMLDLSGRMICQWGAAGPMDGQFNRPVALCVQSDGGLILADTGNNRLQAFARRYRTVGPPVPAQVPLPSVVSSRQRPGTTIVDVEYEVVDPDSPTVHVGALAFVDGAENFRNLLRVTTLEEGTRTNLGANVPTGQRRRIAWNAGADWPADYGNVQVEILANDGRGLVDFHFLSLPGQGADPTLVISRSPVTTNDLLSCWYWLVATNDPAIALSDGRIYGAGGADNGRLLAWDAVLTNGVSVTTNAPTDIRTNVAVRLLEGYTTPAGRQFLFRRMNVREATEAEVQRAMAANTPGFTNRWTPRISVGPDRFPRRVNQYGFDTGNWGPDAWWVVPLYAVK